MAGSFYFHVAIQPKYNLSILSRCLWLLITLHVRCVTELLIHSSLSVFHCFKLTIAFGLINWPKLKYFCLIILNYSDQVQVWTHEHNLSSIGVTNHRILAANVLKKWIISMQSLHIPSCSLQNPFFVNITFGITMHSLQ